jgi:hypothetical protein
MLAYRTNPTMPKKPHQADATDRAKIASAVGYTTSFFLGAGLGWDKHPSSTLDGARDVGRQMAANPDYARTGRKPLIYAHLPDGSEVLVPDDYVVGELPGEGPITEFLDRNRPVEFKPTGANTGPLTINGKPLLHPDGPMQAGDLIAGQMVDTQPIADALAALAAFPGLKKLSQRHLDLLESAHAGVLPTPPDFTADTHKNYRAKLARIVEAIAAGDVAALEAVDIKPVCSSSIPMARFRNLAVIALKARASHRGVS